jgi:Protein of unknown function (DUF4236)
MGLYFRKSINVGPFRFNLSKSGIGMSAGVRGLRIGTGPKGHYVRAGINGLHYQQKLGGSPKRKHPQAQPAEKHEERLYSYTSDGIKMWSIDSADSLRLNQNSTDPILEDLNEKASKIRISLVLPLILAIPAIAVAYVLQNEVLRLAIPAIFVLVGVLLGVWYDTYARTAVLMYDFDEPSYRTYGRLRDAFDSMQEATKAWHIPSAGKVETLVQWKRNSGASTIVDRRQIVLEYGLPKLIKSNITVPTIPVGAQKLYFFPDRLLLEERNRYSSISYVELEVLTDNSRFIESEKVPQDAKTVGETWKYVNKKGGPDKRFNDNRILPICLYEDMLLKSDSGLKELVELSRVGPLSNFAAALERVSSSPAIFISNAKPK